MLREQIAQQPPARPPKDAAPEATAVQISQPDKREPEPATASTEEAEQPSQAEEADSATEQPAPEEHAAPDGAEAKQPSQAQEAGEAIEQPISEQDTSILEPEIVPPPTDDEDATSTEEQTVDELPTLTEIPASTPRQEEIDDLPTLAELPSTKAPEETDAMVDDLPTRPEIPATPPQRTSSAVAEHEEEDERIDQRETALLTVPDHERATGVRPDGAEQHNGAVQQEDDQQSAPPSVAVRPLQGHMTAAPYSALTASSSLAARRKLPATVVAILLVLLLGGGIIAWLIAYRPFSVATITNPQQSFSDAKLGLSVLYPTGWDKQIDYAKSTVHFYANSSSRTIQVDIIVANAQTGDLTKYLQQQASALGMTGAKPGAPLSFAGATWQQLQGTVQQKGANFTCTILAASRGNHLYTMIQSATPDTYTDAEHYFFAPMRNSLHFS